MSTMLREVRQRLSRFFSILAIIAIGVGLFAGVKATCYDMKLSADTYYDEQNLMHFRLLSTFGFDEKDMAALSDVQGIKVFPAYYADLIMHDGGKDEVVRVYSFNDEYMLNDVILLEGRKPQAADECMIDGRSYAGEAEIGDTISLYSVSDQETEDVLAVTEFKIVGKYMSPLYVSALERGSTNIGDGSISSSVYILDGAFAYEYYTCAYVIADDMVSLLAYTEEYDAAEDDAELRLEQIAEVREQGRYDEIQADAKAELDDAKAELADEKAKAQAELDDAKAELDDAEQKLKDGAQELADGEAELADAKKELDDAKAEIEDGRKQLDDAKAELDSAGKQIEDGKKELEAGEKELADNKVLLDNAGKELASAKEQLSKGRAEYEANKSAAEAQFSAAYTELEQGEAVLAAGKAEYEQGVAAAAGLQQQMEQIKQALGENSEQYLEAAAQYQALNAQLEAAAVQLAENEAKLIAGRTELQKQEQQVMSALAAGLAEIEKGEADYAAGYAEYQAGVAAYNAGAELLKEKRAEFEQGVRDYEQGKLDYEQAEADFLTGVSEYEDGVKAYEDGVAELEQAKIDYAEGLAEYEDGKHEYEEGLAEFEQEIADAEAEIADAEAELADLEMPEWYIFTRSDNPAYAEYGENAERINNIAKVFPVFFVLVAALVCLTGMTRMVDEQRTQIGTMKALGYKSGQIMMKYLFYALTASVLGALIGLAVGTRVFPWVIITAYGMMYDMPTLLTPFDFELGAYCVAATIVCVSITVWASCRSCLKQEPAQLMRPKAPPAGKRVFLERIGFFWNRLDFSKKVSVRNIVRYKKRMLMTIVGVSGCTALLLTGFGLRDSIGDIISKQFGDIWKYQVIAAFDENAAAEDYQFAIDAAARFSDTALGMKTVQKNFDVETPKKTFSATVLIPEDAELLDKFVNLHSRTKDESYTLHQGECIVSEKLAKMAGKNVGDEMILLDDGKEISIRISAITEHYANHYVYMTAADYESLFGEMLQFNTMLLKTGALSAENESVLAEELLKNDNILQVNMTSDIRSGFEDMIKILDFVMIVLILSAGALAFVVLYNLTNININERIREIATLKVLGFRSGEVSSYIFRENIIITMLGAVAGLLLGYFLAMFVIQTAEVDMVMFGREIYPVSYLLSFVITMFFSLVVSLVMRRSLDKISMVESLKSVE